MVSAMPKESREKTFTPETGVMEKRPHRIAVNCAATIDVEGKTLSGYVANLSEHGIGLYLQSVPNVQYNDYIPGKSVEIHFQAPDGQILDLLCIVKWLHTHKIPSFDMVNSLGMEIVEAGADYLELFKSMLGRSETA